MFSFCPFRSLLENDQDLWFRVKIEKVIKENVRMKQNKISQNIRTKDDCPSPYDSLGLDMGAIWNPLGSLWGLFGPLWSCMDHPQATNGHLWPKQFPLFSLNGSLRVQYAPKWTLMDPMAPLWPLMVAYGPIWAPYCAKVGQMGCRWPLWP